MEIPSRFETLTDQIEATIKLSVGTVAILYVVGFLMATMHHAHFHIATFTLIKPQYILAGMWAVLPVAFSLAIIYLGSRIKADLPPVPRAPAPVFCTKHPFWSFVRQMALELSVSCVVVLCALALTECAVYSMSGNEFLSEILGFRLVTIIILLSMFTRWFWDDTNKLSRFVRALSVSVGDKSQPSPNFPDIVATLIGLFIGITAYLQLFGSSIYVHIPSSIGGGKPTNVVFLLKPDAHTSDPNIPLLAGPVPGHSRIYPLLLETEKDYYVIDISANGEGEVISFSRECVNGYIVSIEKSLISQFLVSPSGKPTTSPTAITSTATGITPVGTTSSSQPSGP